MKSYTTATSLKPRTVPHLVRLWLTCWTTMMRTAICWRGTGWPPRVWGRGRTLTTTRRAAPLLTAATQLHEAAITDIYVQSCVNYIALCDCMSLVLHYIYTLCSIMISFHNTVSLRFYYTSILSQNWGIWNRSDMIMYVLYVNFMSHWSEYNLVYVQYNYLRLQSLNSILTLSHF